MKTSNVRFFPSFSPTPPLPLKCISKIQIFIFEVFPDVVVYCFDRNDNGNNGDQCVKAVIFNSWSTFCLFVLVSSTIGAMNNSEEITL